mmetsp:Transcript_24199/g.37946  ORF Transcript_24199/g.37946 Transcript_24199/m.37946 type:complete len:211 (+) Transcript_24199:109-741(+)|eukprot:CAMPEP_0201727408 /NCGR_PEP_ID=MMETSP0593-20130828/12246_1 /ASSEMBLY_ACC=CAM_ASM_000672 /TAXON_ID=267983 /ORGANISM="Skeletonema japonicum, Strain CCMP2506" /LENGTH=210 /DNA_ID=CAMNT_0048219205 /DNA_START=100 /DNA_END=732 /DNA_ORIENTATION=-
MVKFTAAKLLTTITLAILFNTTLLHHLTVATTTESLDESTTSSPSSTDNAEFFHTCSEGNYPKFKSLLTTNNPKDLIHSTTPDGEHCLHLVAISGNTQIATTLLKNGADPDIRSTWKNGLRMHPLSWNTFYGRFEIVELLLQYGADVEADFDLNVGSGGMGELEKVTVLDVVEKILSSEMEEEERMRFVKTRNVLMRYGAVRYATVEPEL